MVREAPGANPEWGLGNPHFLFHDLFSKLLACLFVQLWSNIASAVDSTKSLTVKQPLVKKAQNNGYKCHSDKSVYQRGAIDAWTINKGFVMVERGKIQKPTLWIKKIHFFESCKKQILVLCF